MNTKMINRNFRIKVFGMQDGKKINTLVGCAGLEQLAGKEKAQRFIERAFGCGKDKCDCKIYGGLRITFYVK